MKFLPLPTLEGITSSLNFDTADCHISGGCEIYTTKAARSDRRLYKNIEHSLEAQYESVLRFSASLSPPNAHDAAKSLNLSRSSPFGPLSEHSSRQTFTYLIATLNASNPDYDHSHVLRPTDFHRERNLQRVMNTFNSTLLNLRPRDNMNPSPASSVTLSGSFEPGASLFEGSSIWKKIDEPMSLRECSIFTYVPEEDPDVDDGVIWSLRYFFFNPLRKRVCYLYLRGIPILSHTASAKRTYDDGYPTSDISSSKRTKYWGEDVGSKFVASDSDDEMDRPSRIRSEDEDIYVFSDDEDHDNVPSRRRVRAMSEEIVANMEV